MPLSRRALVRTAALPLAGLAGCVSPPRPPVAEGWHEVRIPGKRATRYSWEVKSERMAILAQAEASASMWRRKLRVPPERIGTASFAWWVDDLIGNADVTHVERTDAPVRVLFGFEGDSRRLPMRTRMMFELAQALTGEEPPYATLAYVWANDAPEESVLHNPRTDRVRKIVADSGRQHLGRWRDHRRDLAADFHRAYGEPPGALVSIAVMTDADNTASSARAWYTPPRLG